MSAVTTRTLNTALRKAGRRVEKITDGTTNWGGCCVYAGMVGLKLQELGVTCGMVVRSWGGNLDEARKNVTNRNDPREWNAQGVYFGHVGVEYVIGNKVYHYDSEELTRAGKHHAFDAERTIPGRLTVDEAVGLASTPKGWNRAFDRDFIPKMQRAVDDAFAPLLAALDAQRQAALH